MAYSDYPDYNSAYDKYSKLSFKLYGAADRRDLGLAAAMDRIASEQGEDSALYKKTKAQFDALKRDHDAAKSRWESIKAEIDAKSPKPVDKKEQSVKADVDSLTFQIQQAERRNDIAKVEALKLELQATQEALDTIRNPEEAPADGADTLGVTGTDRYPNYTYQNDGSVVGKDGVRQYIVTLPVPDKRPGGPVTNKQQPFDTPTKARDAFIKSYYGSDNGINRLKTQLLQNNWIKQSQLADGSWVKGLDDFIADYTAHVVREDKYGTATDSISITDYLGQKKPSGGQSAVQTYRTYSTRGEAKRMFDEYMVNLLGRPGTEEENTEYFKILNKEENKAVSTIVDGTKRGSNLDDADRVMLAVKVAKKALKGTTVESILNSKTGSQAANDISSLQSTASAYGIELDAATALRYVAEGLGTENSLNKQKERLRLNAMQLYPTFKEHISAGGTVKDIADVYAYARQKKLGVVIPNSTQDKKVMAAALAGKSIADYDREMQGEDAWGFSEEAGEIGADFTQTILRSFGFGG
jgi:hypothetical protein